MNTIIKFGYIKFKDFLSESFNPKIVDYGTDFSNKKWKTLDNNFFVTFFESTDNQYTVIYRNGHIGFGTGWKNLTTENIDNINTFDEIDSLFHLTKKKNYKLSSALTIFNQVFYVILEGIKKFNPDKIFFNGSNAVLEEFYGKMMKDKTILKNIENNGYIYKGFDLDEDSEQNIKIHIFVKK